MPVVLPTVAIALLVLHIPPDTELLNVIVERIQTPLAPDIVPGSGIGFTVITVVASEPDTE